MTSYNPMKMKTASSAVAQVADNEDLLTEILLRLPAKDLIRFRVVSKQWLSIISSPRFCLSHAKATLKPSALFVEDFHSPPSEFKFLSLTQDCVQLPPFDFIDMPSVMIVQSCFGLLLCVSYNSSFESGCRYFICNPTTRQFKILPFPSPQVDDDYVEHVAFNLAFDPLKSPYYKILSVRKQKIKSWQTYDKPNFCIDIYSSETKSWSLSRTKFTWNTCILFDYCVFLKGAIHWCSNGRRETLYFDVENECIKRMPMPEVEIRACQYFGESGGHLHFVFAYVPDCSKFSVFEMAEDYSDWILKYSLNLYAQLFAPSMQPFWVDFIGFRGYQMFCFIQSEEEGDSIVLLYKSGKAISYNLRDDTLTQLHCPTTGKYVHGYYLSRACQFTETLFCP